MFSGNFLLAAQRVYLFAWPGVISYGRGRSRPLFRSLAASMSTASYILAMYSEPIDHHLLSQHMQQLPFKTVHRHHCTYDSMHAYCVDWLASGLTQFLPVLKVDDGLLHASSKSAS
jgi:hypothetical protein